MGVSPGRLPPNGQAFLKTLPLCIRENSWKETRHSNQVLWGIALLRAFTIYQITDDGLIAEDTLGGEGSERTSSPGQIPLGSQPVGDGLEPQILLHG